MASIQFDGWNQCPGRRLTSGCTRPRAGVSCRSVRHLYSQGVALLSNMSKLESVFLVFLVLQACSGPMITSMYSAMIGVRGGTRTAAHAGVDFRDWQGAPVLATAGGEVTRVTEGPTGCGIGVLIEHKEFDRHTVYCHLEKAQVRSGQKVRRGDVIGHIGTTGNAVGTPHVHLELCGRPCPRGHSDGNLEGTEDPLAISIGCFDAKKTYPTDQLVLTYPVKCAD